MIKNMGFYESQSGIPFELGSELNNNDNTEGNE